MFAPTQARRASAAILASMLLSACGNEAGKADPSLSAGQVKPVASGSAAISFYAASRMADQVSFGATPALVSELSRSGLEAWIDAQFALPPTIENMPREYLNYVEHDRAAEHRLGQFHTIQWWRDAMTAPDQLRLRVTWALFEFIPVGAGAAYGHVAYYNMLTRGAFGNYGQLLRDVTTHPAMGFFLNNDLNRPRSPACLGCSPNENYARELMQLFSIGVVQLNTDGTSIRNAQGKPKETYGQKDVEEMARALTGWRGPNNNTGLPEYGWPHFDQPMIPESNPTLHDSGAKTVMGTPLAAGMNAAKELDAVIAMLMKHPNIAPFVSLRLIQHLVTSNPSPAYLARVAIVFRNNGKGEAGDLKAVVKAILLDPEARRGDLPGTDTARFGKLREPLNYQSSLMRGMECTGPIVGNVEQFPYVDNPPSQWPDNPPSVFSFYQATDRAPGSNLLSPEQKLLNMNELTSRMGAMNWRFIDPNNRNRDSNLLLSGCNLAPLAAAFSQSPKAFVDLVSMRFFRGAMPPTLRSTLQSLMVGEKNWNSPQDGAISLLQFALTSPYYGVIK